MCNVHLIAFLIGRLGLELTGLETTKQNEIFWTRVSLDLSCSGIGGNKMSDLQTDLPWSRGLIVAIF